jgi:anti-anti-sigma factor
MNHRPEYRLLQEADPEICGVYSKVTGEVSEFTAPRLEEDLTDWAHRHGGASVLDLREVRYLDGTGIKMVCRLFAAAKRRGARLVLVTNAFQDTVLKVVRLHTVLPAAKTREEAASLLRGATAS